MLTLGLWQLILACRGDIVRKWHCQLSSRCARTNPTNRSPQPCRLPLLPGTTHDCRGQPKFLQTQLQINIHYQNHKDYKQTIKWIAGINNCKSFLRNRTRVLKCKEPYLYENLITDSISCVIKLIFHRTTFFISDLFYRLISYVWALFNCLMSYKKSFLAIIHGNIEYGWILPFLPKKILNLIFVFVYYKLK